MSDVSFINPSQSLLDPYIKITIGKLGDTEGDTFVIGDGKLKAATVFLSEGKAQSGCTFSVLDPDRKLTDKYFTYVEKVGGLDPVKAEDKPNTVVQASDAPPPTSSNISGGKLIFENVEASTFGYGEATQGGTTGAWGDKIDFNGMYAAMFDSMSNINKYKYAKMRVTNLSNQKSIVVTIITTGPFAVGTDGRAIRPLRQHPTRKIDLVPGAWKALTNNAPPGIINVNIELLEEGIATKARGGDNTGTTPDRTRQETVEVRNTANRATAATAQPFKREKIADWPVPKVGPTKTLLITPGHRVDISSGTNGTSSNSVTYGGENRTVESVTTEIAAQVFREELNKAGFRVINPPPLPSERGDAARAKYQDEVKKLKESTNAYAIELHFDAPPDGRSGVIPGGKYDSSGASLSAMDVALGKEFRTFSFYHRQPLGAPSRGITILELDNLNANLTNLTIAGVNNGNFTGLRAALRPYALRAVRALATITEGITVSTDAASASAQGSSVATESVPTSVTLAGSQITVEMGYGGKTISAYSFLHTGVRFSLFEPNTLEFTGVAASWVMTQRVKNTVYTSMTFKKVATKITNYYGMKLEMPEEGPLYEYFPQRGHTDYEALLIEARRLGYRVYTKGPTLFIQPRAGVIANKDIFVLDYGSNLGLSFEVVHRASTDTKGGARSSEPGANNTTGERKFELNPDTGTINQKRKENIVGTGGVSVEGSLATTGSPVNPPSPKTIDGTKKADSERRENDKLYKGITANTSLLTTPEALTLDPDTPLLTRNISTFLDRMWVIDKVEHSYAADGFKTTLSLYSPLKKNTQGTPGIIGVTDTSLPPSDGYIIPAKGVFTSPFGVRTLNGATRMHNGIDIANSVGTPVVAAAAGNIIFAGQQRGYGNVIYISHPNDEVTVYGHLNKFVRTSGLVNQGEIIAEMGSTGFSTGPHLHWEIRVKGRPIDPASRVKLPAKGGRV